MGLIHQRLRQLALHPRQTDVEVCTEEQAAVSLVQVHFGIDGHWSRQCDFSFVSGERNRASETGRPSRSKQAYGLTIFRGSTTRSNSASAQNLRLDGAVNNITQALLMFDSLDHHPDRRVRELPQVPNRGHQAQPQENQRIRRTLADALIKRNHAAYGASALQGGEAFIDLGKPDAVGDKLVQHQAPVEIGARQ